MYLNFFHCFETQSSLVSNRSTLTPIQANGAQGASVTMPHKITIMKHVDHLTDEAQEVGACNTIFVREIEGKRILFGTNTDVVGIREAFFQNVQNYSVFRNRPGMVIGGGGAARSAVYALKRWLHCNPIYVVNRDKSEVDALLEGCKTQRMPGQLIHVDTVEQAERLEAPGAIVACVPDFPPQTENERRARNVIDTFLSKPRKGAILEMCYHPSPWTDLAALAQSAGWQVILGTEAMIWQGLEQDRYWTGLPLEKLPVEEVKAAIAEALTKSKL